MRVLLTGADGFVGQHVARLLLERGHDVVGAVQELPPKGPTLVGEEAGRVDWRVFDLGEGPSVRALVRDAEPDAVVHLAGSSSVGRSWTRPVEVMEINAMGALHLLLSVRELPAPDAPRPVLLAGSGEAYGVAGTEGDPLTEDMPLRPTNPYAASKAAQEAIGWALGRSAATRLILTRGFPQAGPGQRPPFVLPQWTVDLLRIRAGALKPELRVGDLTVTRDFTDVRDAAEAYVRLIENDGARGAFNLCSGRAFLLEEVLATLCRLVGVEPRIERDPALVRPTEIPSLVGSFAKLEAVTGWSPTTGLEAMLAALVADLEGAP